MIDLMPAEAPSPQARAFDGGLALGERPLAAVTGASSGIGYELARLAQAHVGMAEPGSGKN